MKGTAEALFTINPGHLFHRRSGTFISASVYLLSSHFKAHTSKHVAQSLNMILVPKGKSRTSIISITIESHHITRSRDAAFTLLALSSTSGTSIGTIRRTMAIALLAPIGRLVLCLTAIGGKVVPGAADRVGGLHHAGHGGLVFDAFVLVIEGAETEHLLEELPGAD